MTIKLSNVGEYELRTGSYGGRPQVTTLIPATAAAEALDRSRGQGTLKCTELKSNGGLGGLGDLVQVITSY